MNPSDSLIRATIRDATIGQILVGPVTLYLIGTYVITDKKPRMSALPPVQTLYFHYFMANVVNEILFYFAHRMFHEVEWLYKNVHKQHHQFIGTIGFAAEYAHPLEQVVANQGPTALWCIANSVHPMIWFVWLFWRLWETYEAHSGYCFEGSLPHKFGFTNSEHAKWHDYHHTMNKGNYGSEVMDYLFGSMDSWVLKEERNEKETIKN